MLKLIFWGLLLFIFYAYLGYPLLLWIWARLRRKPVKKKNIYPFVSILICVHNEEKTIRKKLENCFSLNYPEERLEVIVANDGSTDGTEEIVRQYISSGVRLLTYPARRGKASVLNEAIPECKGEIVTLTDARQSFDKDAIKELVANFNDPSVGVVSGELYIFKKDEGPADIDEGVVYYWQYEKTIRKLESDIDSVAGATGSIYAIRKSLFEPIPEDTLIEDVLIPLNIIRKGYRVIFEPKAMAYDRASSSNHEFYRKVRTMAGNYQLLFRHRWMFSLLQNRIAIQVISHRLFQRILMPFVLILIFLINLGLDEGFYRMTLLFQTFVYSISLIGALMSVRSERSIFVIPYVFLLFNFSALVGFISFFAKNHTSLWRIKSG